MRRIKTVKPAFNRACFLGLICLHLASSPALSGATPDKGDVLITKNCARCHATGATGDSPHKEAPPFRTIVLRYPLESLAEALAEGIVSGHPDMPEFIFPPDEIDAILAYLGKLKSETSNVNGATGGRSP